jgi:hypothetical protein
MIQPFAEDHGTGAQMGPWRQVGLSQAGCFDHARRLLHSASLAQIAARWN